MNSIQPRKIPTQVRARQKVDKLLETAERLLCSEGIESITTPKIAEVSGVTVGSIYQYFPNKEAIVSELYVRWLDNAFQEVEKFTQIDQPYESLGDYLSKLFLHVMRDTSEYEARLSVELTNALRVNKQLQALDQVHEERLSKEISQHLFGLGLISKSKPTQLQLQYLTQLLLNLTEMVSRSSSDMRDGFVEYSASTIKSAVKSLL